MVRTNKMHDHFGQTVLACDALTLFHMVDNHFEQEVPEIYDGLITIKKVVRVPGERAKVAVESYDERIDPIGACIGVKGSRIIGIVRELRNENIDVLQWTNNTQLLIQRAINPAKISSIVGYTIRWWLISISFCLKTARISSKSLNDNTVSEN